MLWSPTLPLPLRPFCCPRVFASETLTLPFVSAGLLGIGGGDSSSDSSGDEVEEGGGGGGGVNGKGGGSGATVVSSVPEGLPADFFDEDVDTIESGASSGALGAEEARGGSDSGGGGGGIVASGAQEGKEKRPSGGGAAAKKFGAERAAELAAEAAVLAEADALRQAETLAAMRAAGMVQVVGTAEAAATTTEADRADVDGGAGVSETGAGVEAPNGSALPEGFFDDPEVDAKSRGVDLKAKKKEEEQ